MLKYYAGQAIPGAERRSKELPDAFGDILIHPGTLNIALIDVPPLSRFPSRRFHCYRLWPCSVTTAEMIIEEFSSIPGWVMRVDGEHLQDNFVEIVSTFNLRKRLKREKWPAFSVELALELENEA
jgi:hypothetical protein